MSSEILEDALPRGPIETSMVSLSVARRLAPVSPGPATRMKTWGTDQAGERGPAPVLRGSHRRETALLFVVPCIDRPAPPEYIIIIDLVALALLVLPDRLSIPTAQHGESVCLCLEYVMRLSTASTTPSEERKHPGKKGSNAVGVVFVLGGRD